MRIRRAPGRGGGRLSIVFAFAALAAAVAAAVVPATPQRATFSWPPAHVPDRQPVRSWFAPLMLNRRTADSIRVRLPCRPGPVLPGAGARVVVLATARRSRRAHALGISWWRDQRELRVGVGASDLGRFAVPLAGPCILDVRVSGRRWTIRQSGGRASAGGELAARVGVNGLISQLDLRRAAGLRVEVTPAVQDTRPSPSQTALRLLAVLFLVLALWSRLGSSRLMRPRLALRRLLARPSYPDAFVALTLIAWWILGPVYYDDGWVTARQANYLDSGGFSNYFDNYAANLPFGTWFEWLQHLLVGHTTALVIQRIPSVACLASLWLVSRAILSRLVGSPSRSGNVAWWSSALVFCIGAAAFGVTLRPEPLNALLVGGVLLCGVRFAARPAIAPLAAAAVVTGLALSEHPEGVVALAPLLICVPRIVREVRRRTSITCGGVLAVLVCGLAWTVLLGFLDSDLYHRLADARSFREGEGHSGGVISEWLRYQALWWSSSLRREFVVVCVLCVLALLGRRPRRLEERLPSASLGLGLLLLAFVPSKWVWGFGVLIGLSAVAVGTEVARFASALSTQRRSFVPLVFAFLAVAFTLAWAGSTPARWGPLDLRTTSHVYFAAGAAIYALWAIFVLFGIAAAAALRRRDVAARLSRQAATLSLAFILAPVLALTTLVFSVDTLATPGWTYARQSVAVLAGRSTCGLADYLVVPDSRSMTAMARIGPSPRRTVAGGAPPAPLAGVDVLGVGSPGGRSMAHSRWYRFAGGGRALGLYAGGTWRRSESLVVVWGRVRGGRVVQAGMGSVKLSKLARRGPEPASWRFVAQTQLPQRPRGADALRLRIIGAADRARGAFVTGPIAYSDVSLRARIGRPSTTTLVSPFLLESMPCARLPAVELGVGQPPTLLVDWNLPPFMTDPQGPFGAIPDLFQLRRLPLADSPQRPRPREVSVYETAVDSRDALLPTKRLAPESG